MRLAMVQRVSLVSFPTESVQWRIHNPLQFLLAHSWNRVRPYLTAAFIPSE